MKHSFRILPLILSLALPGARGANSPADGPVEISPGFVDQLMAEAGGRNPSVLAAGARADAASAAVESVRTWEDPVATFGIWESTPRGMPASQEGNLVYGLEQKLPVFGRPGLAREAAQARAEAERLNAGYATAVLRRDLLLALADIAETDADIGLARLHLGWIDAMAASVDSRYRTGSSSQVEWLTVQTEKSEAAEQLTSLRSMLASREESADRLLNRARHAPWPDLALPEVAGPVEYGDRLVSAALAYAPRFRALQQETAATEAAARMTQSRRLPEVGVGVETRQYSGDAGFREGMVSVNLSLPWANRSHYDSDLARDKAMVRAAERDAEAYANSVREEIHHLSVDVATARRRALLYRDQILPLAEQTLSSAEASWESSRGRFQDILDAHRAMVEDQISVVRSRADQLRGLAELTLLTGADDPAAAFPPGPQTSEN
jgi:outer membrane protein TolC